MADLAALLDREATAEIEGILAEARERASEIIAAAEEEAASIATGRQRAAEAQYQASLVRARSAAQLEASSLTLQAQHEAIESVFAQVERSLADVTSKPGYADVLGALIREALQGGGVAPGEVQAVVVNPADQKVATAAAQAAGVSAPVETSAAVRGGARLRVANDVVIENTLFGRLESLRDELAAEVAQVLLSKEA